MFIIVHVFAKMANGELKKFKRNLNVNMIESYCMIDDLCRMDKFTDEVSKEGGKSVIFFLGKHSVVSETEEILDSMINMGLYGYYNSEAHEGEIL